VLESARTLIAGRALRDAVEDVVGPLR